MATKRRKRKRQPPPPEWAGETTKQLRVPRMEAPSAPEGFDYTSDAVCLDKFNKLDRGRCLVQFTFRKGKPFLRFCDRAGGPGIEVRVESPAEASKMARRACDNFKRTGDYGLSGLRRRRR